MNDFILISGPCSLESVDGKVALEVCESIVRTLEKYPNIKYIFKSSWLKANRTREDSFCGIGFDQAMNIFVKIKETFGVKIITDVHETIEVKELIPYVDYLQIPAYLARQTSLIKTAAEAKPLNIKKPQFASANDMKFALDKAKSVGQNEVFLCERGSCFGYDNLVVDFVNIPIMKSFGAPVILDATHSLQRKLSIGVSGGSREHVPMMCKAGIVCGVDGLFLEVHSDVQNALSDAATQLELNKFAELLDNCMEIRSVLQ